LGGHKKLKPVLAVVAFAVGALVAADHPGKATYDAKCKTCHGPDGAGNAAIAKTMKVTLRHLGSKEVQALSDADIKKIITGGQGKMKSVTGLSDKQVNDVTAYVRTLKP
jgi:mono/diheme cytochrome c family protein